MSHDSETLQQLDTSYTELCDRRALHEAHQNLQHVPGESEYVARSALFADRRLSLPMQRVARRVWASLIAQRENPTLLIEESVEL